MATTRITDADGMRSLCYGVFVCLALVGGLRAEGGHEHSDHEVFPSPNSLYYQENLTETKILDSEETLTPNPRYDGDLGLWAKLKKRAGDEPFYLVATLIFFCAIIHTFLASKFMKISHRLQERHDAKIRAEGRTADDKPHDEAIDDVSHSATIMHFLGEVEAVFGIWLVPLAIAFLVHFGISWDSWHRFEEFIGNVHYTEPLFVVVIMAISSSRPILRFAENALERAASLGGKTAGAWWLSIMCIAPIFGSFITEPAAMTIAALLLGKKFYALRPSVRFSYATLGLLFVNVSVGGTLTHFAAPPVLMVVRPWNWDIAHMFVNFGWKAFFGVLICNGLYYAVFKKEFAKLNRAQGEQSGAPLRWHDRDDPIPWYVTLVHLGFLAWTVFTLHVPALFIGGFLFYLAFVQATEHHQNAVVLKGPLLVGFFLAALVTHSKFQGWWIDAIISQLGDVPLMVGSTILTAFNDNAAITLLATQAYELTDAAKYAVVAGAVTGGGLTVIANAPNPAGQSILRKYFGGGVSPAGLFLGAVGPTIIMGLFFMLIR